MLNVLIVYRFHQILRRPLKVFLSRKGLRNTLQNLRRVKFIDFNFSSHVICRFLFGHLQILWKRFIIFDRNFNVFYNIYLLSRNLGILFRIYFERSFAIFKFPISLVNNALKALESSVLLLSAFQQAKKLMLFVISPFDQNGVIWIQSNPLLTNYSILIKFSIDICIDRPTVRTLRLIFALIEKVFHMPAA